MTVDWKEPSNCPKCGCGWGILIKPDDVKVIFCSNARCTFAWGSKADTLLEAVVKWNVICEEKHLKDRPDTPPVFVL
jgi:hypothetical protein